jgi:hypothetical protein
MGCAASPRRDGKLALTDGITLSDEELRGEAGQADPIRSDLLRSAALTVNG